MSTATATAHDATYARVMDKINAEAALLLRQAWQQHCWYAHFPDSACAECRVYQDALLHLGDDTYAY